MPDDNEYEGLSREEIAAIKGDDEGDAVIENSQTASEIADTITEGLTTERDKEEDKSNQKDDNVDKSDDEQSAENDNKSGDKAADADDSQKKDADADKEPDDKAKKSEGDVQDSDASKTLDDDSKDTDTQPDATKEQRPFVSTLPEVDATELGNLKTALDEAKKKFADGDIDYSELDIVKDAYNELKWKSEFTATSNLNTRETLWKWEQDRFLDDNEKFKDNVTLNAAFISVVNGIIATEDGGKLTDRQVLAKAKKQVETDLGLIPSDEDNSADKSKAAESKKQAAIAAAKKTNADRSNIAADIGGLPSAEENVDTDPFTYLDNLEGEKFQAAIDKLSPEQIQKYEDRQ